MKNSDDEADFLGFSNKSYEEGESLLKSLDPIESRCKSTAIDYSQSDVVSLFINPNSIITNKQQSPFDPAVVLLERID
jgi:hypothetical protein